MQYSGSISEIQRQIFRQVRRNNFERVTGIPGWAVAAVLRESRNCASIFCTPVALEERVREWVERLKSEYCGIHFRHEILDFNSYCTVFQSGWAGRSEKTLPLFNYVRDHKQEIFGINAVYEGVQFREYCRVITEVDFVTPEMLVKVDEPLRQAQYRSEHRARKHNSLRRAGNFLENNDYPACSLVRLEGIPLGNGRWEITLYDIDSKKYVFPLQKPHTEPRA